MRFGLVVLVTFALYFVLQQIAAVIVLFGVTMWMRNPNMQGLHDRFAHTIVVERRRKTIERFVDVGASAARSTSTRSKKAAATRSTCSAARARTSPR